MTKEMFQNAIYPKLIEKGYKEVKIANGEPYNAKDWYMCPQAPELYMLTILPGRTEIRKIGENSFRGDLSVEVQGPEDIDKMHEEINNVIYRCDKSSLKNQSSGCMVSLLMIPFIYFIYLIS
jgi:hypothetical protein